MQGLLAEPSCVITRIPPKLERLPAISQRERYVPQWLLFGVLPENLLLSYHFYRQEQAAPAAGHASLTELRGYFVGAETLVPHVLSFELRHLKLDTRGDEAATTDDSNTTCCATVTRRALDSQAEDLLLLDLLSASPSDDLYALARVLMRLEHLAHILVWSRVRAGEGAGHSAAPVFSVDLVELPRLQLSFRSRPPKQPGRSPRLYSVEMPQLFVYRPPGGIWPDDILVLIEDVPHGLMMLSDTQQQLLLVPNLKLGRLGSVLVPDRDEQWERSAISPYFIYEVHVSKQFFITTSLASALYLCLIRYLSGDFAACFELVDSIATDRAFDEEEQQIFDLLALTSKTAHPNASACLCKIALAVEDAPVQLPVALSYHAAVFVRSKSLVSVRCRLSEEQELRLMQLISEQQLRSAAVDSVLKQSDSVIVKAAAASGGPKAGAQAKMVQELSKSILAAAAGEGVTIEEHDVPLLAREWLKSKADGASEQSADEYDLVVLANRRKQLEFRQREREAIAKGCRDSEEGNDVGTVLEQLWNEDATKHAYVTYRKHATDVATGKQFTFDRLEGLGQTAPEQWLGLNLQYKLERRLTAARLSEIVGQLAENQGKLDGEDDNLGFLWLYDLLVGQVEYEQGVRGGDKLNTHDLATLLMGFFADVAPSTERHSTTLLAEILAVLASNPAACEATDRPRLDGSAFDGSDDAKIWRAKPLDGATDGADQLPLGALLEGLLDWLPRQQALTWPSYTPTPAPTFPVTNTVQELGLFARRPIGLAVADSSCSRRVFDKARLAVLQPAMRQLKVDLKAEDLPLEVSRQPLRAVLEMTPSFTEEEKVVVETREQFGFNISQHKRVQTHIIARSVIERIQGDMATYSKSQQSSTKLRLREVGVQFETLLGSLNFDDDGSVGGDPAAAAAQIEKASALVVRLQEALQVGQRAELDKVSKAILLLGKLANHCDVPPPDAPPPAARQADSWRDEVLARYSFAILRVGELETDIDFTFIVRALLSSSDVADWASVNPFIGESVQSELTKLAATMLLHASAISAFNMLIVECTKLSGMLGGLAVSVEKRSSQSELRVKTSGVVNLADSIAASLHVERHYIADDFSYDPRLLVFEFIRSLVLRRGQVEIVHDFMCALSESNLAAIAAGVEQDDVDKACSSAADARARVHRLAVQVLMGQGKTAVITPLLCLLLADGESVPIVLLPDSLLDAARNIIRSTFASVIVKRVYQLECSRATSNAQRFLSMFHNALQHKGVVVTTPTSAKSAILKFVENLITLNDDAQLRGKRAGPGGARPLPRRARATLDAQTRSWAGLLQQFQRSVLIMDELDWVCHPMKSELNFPIGNKVPLDFGEESDGKRWAIALHLFDGISSAKSQVPPQQWREDKRAYDLLRRLSSSMQQGYEEDALQRQPHTVLLNDHFYRAELRPILADWMILYLQAAQLGNESGVGVGRLRAQILGDVDEAQQRELVAKLKPDEWKLLNLTADWLNIFL